MTATGGALAAAMIGRGTAHADSKGYSILFGGDGTATGLFAGQAADNATLDTELAEQISGDSASFTTAAAAFEAGDGHSIEDLIYSIDPTAYCELIHLLRGGCLDRWGVGVGPYRLRRQTSGQQAGYPKPRVPLARR
jgi:hypothetical protein